MHQVLPHQPKVAQWTFNPPIGSAFIMAQPPGTVVLQFPRTQATEVLAWLKYMVQICENTMVSVSLPPEPEPSEKPADYEACSECGYDHSYELDEAFKAHAALREHPITERVQGVPSSQVPHMPREALRAPPAITFDTPNVQGGAPVGFPVYIGESKDDDAVEIEVENLLP